MFHSHTIQQAVFVLMHCNLDQPILDFLCYVSQQIKFLEPQAGGPLLKNSSDYSIFYIFSSAEQTSQYFPLEGPVLTVSTEPFILYRYIKARFYNPPSCKMISDQLLMTEKLFITPSPGLDIYP